MTPETRQITILEFALNYAREWGWPVFPCHSIETGACTCQKADCKSPGKHPVASLVPRGVLDATKDEAQIRAWWGALGMPCANIGIATGSVSGLVVLDIDEAKGGNIFDLYIGDIDQDVFESTPEIKTGGGLHFYYKLPAGQIIKNSTSKLAEFIDVRGEGGYVVAPPSLHVSGKNYEFLNDVSTLLEFPAEWVEKLNSVTTHGSQNGNGNGHAQASANGLFVPPPADGLKVPDAINFGSRNNTLIALAGAMRHHGFSEDSIYYALQAENQRLCKPPLDDAEVNQIARSIGRYAPNIQQAPVSDDDPGAPDYENTLKPYLLGDLLTTVFEPKEILSFHIGKKDIAIIQAATNAGKTTLLRNVGLCMAAGRAFLPFYEGGRPIRIAYFDFESDAQDVQRDLAEMFEIFTPLEKDVIKKNLIVIPKGLMGGELFQFNTHEKWANSLIQQNGVEFIFVDNVSAAYDLNDENSNAEVTKKVIKPLLKMASKGDCAFLFAHHYGKGKQTEIEAAGVHAGRGASALQALSRTVINMFGDVSKGEPVTVECAKRKTDGGQNYREVFALKDDRWFHHTTIVPPPPKKTAYQVLRAFFETIVYPDTVSTADVITKFEDQFGSDMVKKTLNELFKDGFIERPKHGQYCGKDLKTSSVQKPKNFYDKDDD